MYTYHRILRICHQKDWQLTQTYMGYKGTRYKQQLYNLTDSHDNYLLSDVTLDDIRDLLMSMGFPSTDSSSNHKQSEPFKLFDSIYTSLRDCAKAFNIQPIRIKENIAKGKSNEQAVGFALIQFAKQEADNYICPNIRLWSYHHTKNKSVYYEYMDLSTGIIDIASDVELLKMYMLYHTTHQPAI